MEALIFLLFFNFFNYWPLPGPDLETSVFLIFLIIDLYQVQIWRPPFLYIFLFF